MKRRQCFCIALAVLFIGGGSIAHAGVVCEAIKNVQDCELQKIECRVTNNKLCVAISQKEYCGNGVKDGTEQCDDGDGIDNNFCSNSCTITPVCGNKVVEKSIGESCDDGNTIDEDGCSAQCQTVVGPGFCGDAIIQTNLGESCDDGNNKDRDGCSAICTEEDAYCTIFTQSLSGQAPFTVSGVVSVFQFLPSNKRYDVTAPNFFGLSMLWGVTTIPGGESATGSSISPFLSYPFAYTYTTPGTYTISYNISRSFEGGFYFKNLITCESTVTVSEAESTTGNTNTGNSSITTITQSNLISSAGGGGGQSLVIDYCPNGDLSPSYYDRICIANTTGTHITNIVNEITIAQETNPAPTPQHSAAPIEQNQCPYTDGDFNTYKNTFVDISSKKQKKAVEKLLDHCLIHGMNNQHTLFGTEQYITQGEMYKIYTRLAKLPFTPHHRENRAWTYFKAGNKAKLRNNLRSPYNSDKAVSKRDIIKVTRNLYTYLGVSTKGKRFTFTKNDYPTRGELAIFLNQVIIDLENSGAL